MILIDEDVDLKLAAALESLRDKPDATRCIYFSLMDKPAIAGIKEKIIASAKQHIATVDTKVYLCGDADICILAPIINSKAGKEFILDVAAHANMPANGEWVTFFEVSLQINKLLITVEQKLEKLMTLYTKAFNTMGWNRYSYIDLQYRDRVVCTKKTDEPIPEDKETEGTEPIQ
jgi:hypothetical protein